VGKLFGGLTVKLIVYILLTLAGMWFYLDFLDATLLNKILFGVFACCLFISLTIDFLKLLEHFKSDV
jgi:hypothetical protein